MSKYVGQRIKRTEDPRLIKGLAHYVDDIKLPDTLYVSFVRSVYAHARINNIDTSEALKAPGVITVYTGEDVAEKIGPVPCASALPDLKVPDYRVLATDKALFVGHPIAAIVATDKYVARDAVDLVSVEYEELPAVVDVEDAAKGGTVIHEKFGHNVAYKLTSGEGDIEAALNSADRIVTQKMIHQRLAPIAMETRGVLARYFPGEEELTIWSSTQIPHLLRTQLALMIGIPENKLRVITPEVGGGFGSKLNVYAEEALLGWISIQQCKPVKWIETRRENVQATIHGRAQVGTIEVGCKNDGTLTGLRYNVFADLGAYHQLLTPAIPTLTGLMLSGAYRIPAIQMNVTGVFTNKMSTDAYRGAGRPEATYVVERAMDIVAAELKMDPVDVRRKNFPRKDEFPFHTATGLDYDSGDYAAALDKALDLSGYANLRAEQTKARAEGKIIGIGMSSYVEICALGPSQAMPAGGWESATVKIEPTGKVTVMTGASPHGQGEETTFAQVTADELGCDIDDILVIHGDTAVVQYGIGTFGSRGTAVGGTALYYALQTLKEKLKKFGAMMLKTDNVTLVGGSCVDEASGKTVSFAQMAVAAYHAKKLPPNTEPGLVATHFWEPPNFTFPFGAHIVVTDVDRDTGEIKIRRYICVDDIGKIINPLIAAGQIHGGLAQG